MPSFKEALEEEMVELEQQLHQSEIYQKLQDIKRLYARYVNTQASARPSPAPPTQRFVRSRVGRLPRGVNPERDRVLVAAAEFLADRKAPTKTAEIYEGIRHLGLEIRGIKPPSTLSAMLNNAKDMFVSHGRDGWTLPTDADLSSAGEDAAANQTPSDQVSDATMEFVMAP